MRNIGLQAGAEKMEHFRSSHTVLINNIANDVAKIIQYSAKTIDSSFQ